MTITPEVVGKVAHLARLELTAEETPRYAEQLSRILELVEKLNQLDTREVQAMTHAVALTMPERPDQVTNGNQREAMLANTAQQADGHFCTPKFVE
ncbi:MAG: Asp-tRNA(Asn)/Glu-tRNA(Gln) amidotransferase subunit GatC [Magnetococcales bacterium]|nr:Asp-tRNA(Asn)/Glu-tRNA(Gln) amidotransferase subunit GatC [Magnetococcales bacterium]NGZ25351.1 Asp-tRNA(Asn)/Glu-tRNA(Gln) amidotransferase subunit GatC [Magnetococcales bacterium]